MNELHSGIRKHGGWNEQHETNIKMLETAKDLISFIAKDLSLTRNSPAAQPSQSPDLH
jgi:hypothetical protein